MFLRIPVSLTRWPIPPTSITLGRTYAHQWLKQLIDGSMLVNPEPRDFLRAFHAIQTLKDRSVTVFDAVAAAVAYRLSLAVWTCDRHFDVLKARRWT